MNRFHQSEALAASTRTRIPGVAVEWLAAVRDPLEQLTMAALDPKVTDSRFRAMVRRFSKSLPGLLESMNHDSLAKLMESGMGASMANGIARRVPMEKPDVARAKLPWEEDSCLFLAGKGKRCGDSLKERTGGHTG